MAVEEVIIDFKVDFSELTTAQEQLAKSGKIDGAGFSAISKSITKTASDTKGLIAEFKRVGETAVKMGKSVEDAFGAGIEDALSEAGVSLEEFSDALKKANEPTKTLKKELNELKNALAQAKVNGTDTGEAFEAMRARAGALSDAISDASAEIRNTGSDTRNIDNVIGSVTALAGGFSIVQGAAALFGDENKDLQKTLVKVNAAMAIATGLQQIQIAVTKEGAVTKLADSVATGIQTATQKLYTIVTGRATAATVAFKVALAATGIGLFVVGLLALVSALNDTEESLDDVNSSLEYQQQLLESSIKLIDRRIEKNLLLAKEAGKAESDLIKIRSQGLLLEYNAIGKTIKNLENERDSLSASSSAWATLNSEIEKNYEKRAEISDEIEKLNIEGRIAIKKESEEKAKALKEDAAKRDAAIKADAARRRAAIKAELEDNMARIQQQLLFVEKNSQEEIDLKKKLVIVKRDIELQAEKLTNDKKRLIRAEAYKNQLDLQENFNKLLSDNELKAQIDLNNAKLAGIQLSNEERLHAQINNIAASAQLEINAAENNAQKIILIEAKKSEAIRALKNKAIDEDLQREIESTSRVNGIVNKALEKIVNDVTLSTDKRIAAAKGIERQELINVDKAIEANKKKEQSDEDYLANYKKLSDQRADIEQATSEKIDEINRSSADYKIDHLKDVARAVIEIAGQVNDFFSQLNQLASDQESARIEAQKRQLQELIDAGAITKKETEVRQKQIEIMERQAKQRAAQREKQMALFSAIINTAKAITENLGNPLMIAFVSALGAAQIALIAAKPIPKFFRGKKDKYEGRGVVADMGAEIVERDGRMYIYTKPTETYLNRDDKVYTAAETKNIIHNTKVNTTIHKQKQDVIDYNKLAKAIPKNNVSINIDKDFISEAVGEGFNKNKYFNNRYKF